MAEGKTVTVELVPPDLIPTKQKVKAEHLAKALETFVTGLQEAVTQLRGKGRGEMVRVEIKLHHGCHHGSTIVVFDGNAD